MDYPVFRISGGGKVKAQSTLETAIAFVVIILFFGGIVRIWLWSNNQIVQRQLHYNATRVRAGTSSDTYKLSDYWPVHKPESLMDNVENKEEGK